MERLDIKIGNIRMETPLVAVSGIYGIDYELLLPSYPYVGAVVTKSVTLKPRKGNRDPRIIETRAGLLNSIGLQNPGIEAFIKDEIPKLRSVEVPIIASVAGSSIQEFRECTEHLSVRDEIDGIELNVSCPNAEMVGIEFGCDTGILEELVATVKKVVNGKTLIVKLTPNVTDIAAMAQAAINGGTDAISLINTLRGMAIDLETQTPKLGNRIGGLSGIGIHPVAVYMIRQCYLSCCRKANIPIIGIGGVANDKDAYKDALEFILAGATCVGIGTAIFHDDGDIPIFKSITQGIVKYLEKRDEKSVQSVQSLIGKAVPEKLFSFQEIAEYLNIPEVMAISLGERQLLPGCSRGGRWETTLDELENWYVVLSGEEWARITANGRVNSLSIETDLGSGIPTEKLHSIMQYWHGVGIMDIVERSVKSDGTAVVDLKLNELLSSSQEALNTLRGKKTGATRTGLKNKIIESVKNSLLVAFQSELTLANQKVTVSLSPDGLLRLVTQDDLATIPQREREIIKFLLTSYAERIASDLCKE